MATNKYIVPIGILIAVIFIIAGGFLVLNPHHPDSPGTWDDADDNESYFEPTQNFIPDVKVQEGELKRNADLRLKTGNRYNYEYKFTIPLNLMTGGGRTDNNQTDKKDVPDVNMKMSGSMDVVVDRKERYNKSDVFVLTWTSLMKYENLEELMMAEKKGNEMTQQEMQQMTMLKEGINTSGETWISNDGKPVKMVTKRFGMEITTEGEKAEGSSMMGGFGANMMIQPWMLALNENFEWTKNTTVNMSGVKSTSSERYKVVNVEETDTKAGRRKCYKVEKESLSSIDMSEKSKVAANTKISGKSVLWIDYNKRILVKAENWMENLKIGTIELANEK